MSALAPGPAHSGHIPLVTVVVTEALDAAAVPVLRDLLDGALALRPERLVVDVAHCPHIDSAAAAVLLEAHREVGRSGGQLAMRELPAGRCGNAQLADLAHEQHVVGRTAGPAPPRDWWAAVWSGTVAAAARDRDATSDPGDSGPATGGKGPAHTATTSTGQVGQ